MLTDATRTRLTFTGETLIAATFLIATALFGLLVVRELRVAPRAVAAEATQPASAAEEAPANSVSIPTLVLGEANEIRVGDLVQPALARFGADVKLVKQATSRGLLGPREIRSYDLSGTKFTLVLEPFERGGQPRVAAIYLQ